MGQYYHPTNLDKKQYLSAHEYDNGLKLMEHSYITNTFVSAIENLLIPGGDWYKNRIVWAGDYADEEPETDWTNKGAQYPNKTIYAIVGHEDGNKIHPKSKRRLKKYRFLVNHTLKTFVDLDALQPMTQTWAETEGQKWLIHPLPLLTCEGNGRGGGDFHGEDAKIGTWARHSISIEQTPPEGYTAQNGQFNDDNK